MALSFSELSLFSGNCLIPVMVFPFSSSKKPLAVSILAKFSEIYAPHIDKANSILSFRVDDENETTEEQQCNSRQ
jgi:hypothetical protein